MERPCFWGGGGCRDRADPISSARFPQTTALSLDRSCASSQPAVLHALERSFGLSLLAAAVQTSSSSGPSSWALVRYEFPGLRLFRCRRRQSFALPRRCAGLALTNSLMRKRLARRAVPWRRSAQRGGSRRWLFRRAFNTFVGFALSGAHRAAGLEELEARAWRMRALLGRLAD